MSDAVVLTILTVAVPLLGWTVLHGLQTGKMDAAGVPYASYARAKNPFMFWFATIFNVAICVTGATLLVAACLQNI